MALQNNPWRTKFLYVIVLFMLIFSSLLFTHSSNAEELSFTIWPSGPTGTISIRKPAVQMKVDFNGKDVAAFDMELNGKKVAVNYDKTTGRFIYVPEYDLASGSYSVKLTFQLKGYVPKQYNWNFIVDTQAISAFPNFTKNQLEALQHVNYIRSQIGLQPVILNRALSYTATAHAGYLNKTGVISHQEIPGKEGFIGADLMDRVGHFGYSNDSVAEDVSQHRNADPRTAVYELFDAPYHREPFLNPGLTEIGFGSEGDFHVILFGIEQGGATSQIVTAPADHQAGVATTWEGNEIPDPLRVHPTAQYPVGYPIMAGVYGKDVKAVTLGDASITDSAGNNVPFLRNSSGEDTADSMLTHEVLLIPSQPLQPNMNFHVQVKLKVAYENGGSGVLDKSWNFSTIMPAATKPKHVAALGLDDDFYSIDGMKVAMTVKPKIIDGSSYLSIRDLEKALGAKVEWDNAAKAAIYTKDNRKVTFYVNQNNYVINGIQYTTSTPAQLINQDTDNPRTMIPVRLLATSFGCKVDYLDASKTILITY